MLTALLLGGCAEQRWAEYWNELPNAWRSGPGLSPSPELAFRVVASGAQGFRFGTTHASLESDSPQLRINLTDGELLEVHWIADPLALYGVVYRHGSQDHILLATNRGTLRQFATQAELILVDNDQRVVTSLPKVLSAFSLDNEVQISLLDDVFDARCVTAEGAELATNEIRLVAKDLRYGEVSDAEANVLQQGLAPFLAAGYRLCR